MATPTTSDARAGAARSSVRRRALGVLASAGVTLAFLPVNVFVVAFAVIAAGRYDSSGSGGPFRSCTADSSACDGPEYWAIAGGAVVLLATAWAAGVTGSRAGRYRHVWRSRIALTGMSAVLAVAAAVAIWRLAH